MRASEHMGFAPGNTRELSRIGVARMSLAALCSTWLVLLALEPISAAEPKPVPAEGAIELIGENPLAAWKQKGGDAPMKWFVAGSVGLDDQDPAKLKSDKGDGILINGEGKAHNLYSQVGHGDIQAHIEFLIPKGSNSGVYFQGRYEIQILDSFGRTELKYGDGGGIYVLAKPQPNNPGGKAPNENASLPPGEWQTYDVLFRAPKFDADGKKVANAKFVRVTHNGKVIHENVEVAGPTRAAGFSDEQPTGPLMIQGDHGPVALRNIRLMQYPADEKPDDAK